MDPIHDDFNGQEQNEFTIPQYDTSDYEEQMSSILSDIDDEEIYHSEKHFRSGQTGRAIGGEIIHDTTTFNEKRRKQDTYFEYDSFGVSYTTIPDGTHLYQCCNSRCNSECLNEKCVEQCSHCGRFFCKSHISKNSERNWVCNSCSAPSRIAIFLFFALVIFLIFKIIQS